MSLSCKSGTKSTAQFGRLSRLGMGVWSARIAPVSLDYDQRPARVGVRSSRPTVADQAIIDDFCGDKVTHDPSCRRKDMSVSIEHR
jgi:hypothetical protein